MTHSVRNAAQGSKVELGIRRAWLDAFEPYDMSPRPASVRDEGDLLVHRFETGGGPLQVVFSGRPHAIGSLPGEVVHGTTRVAFDTFVLP